jgi:hypothetical protein
MAHLAGGKLPDPLQSAKKVSFEKLAGTRLWSSKRPLSKFRNKRR